MNTLLSIHRLQKHFADRQLFSIDTLTIAPASAYVLTGLNGVGKSTLLRILAGMEPAEISQASYLGEPVSFRPYSRRLRDAIVYVHQHPIMFSTTIAGNIGYGLAARGIPKVEAARRVEEAIDWAGLNHLRHSKPHTLSGGEKQRVALARAKVLLPRLLLLDEPTANLDGPSREQVIRLIPTLIEGGSSIIMACHDRDLITLPGVQRLKLRDGQLQTRQAQVRAA
jgi:tungstate transport system ATP-binding protein